jgi:hypothetical protein
VGNQVSNTCKTTGKIIVFMKWEKVVNNANISLQLKLYIIAADQLFCFSDKSHNKDSIIKLPPFCYVHSR